MFLDKEDLYLAILEDELEEITRGDDTLINQAISAAISEARTYLYDSYEVDTIFSATGANRHALLLGLVSDMAIYLLVARVQAGQDVSDRKDRYDRAVAWLKAAKKSETYSDLPRREETVQTHFVSGSLPKRNNRF
jgi:hypothetical protein